MLVHGIESLPHQGLLFRELKFLFPKTEALLPASELGS